VIEALEAATHEVMERLERVRVLPVLSIEDPEQTEDVCRALLSGGIACIEITFRTEAAAAAIARACAVDGMLVGAGTVRSPEQARAALDAGARLAVAPGLDEEVVEACRALALPFVPGAATPTEIGRAQALGCSTVKIFPASAVGGPAFLRAVSAVFAGVRFVPTGGVDASNLGSYLALPSVLACGGSWLCDARLVREGRFAEIQGLAAEAAALAR